MKTALSSGKSALWLRCELIEIFEPPVLALLIAIVSGLLGGGLVFAVPLLVMVGVPLLTAVAVGAYVAA